MTEKVDGSTTNPARNPIQNKTVDRPAGETRTSPPEGAPAAKYFILLRALHQSFTYIFSFIFCISLISFSHV